MQITLLDGGTGQEIYRRSKLTEAPLWSVEAMLNEPEIVTQVHQDFIAAGSEICTLNTYTATPTRLRDTKHKDDLKLIHDLATQSLEAAIKSSGQRVKTAGCLPPIHGSYLDTPPRTFDSLLAQANQVDRSKLLHTTFLTADIGKLYVFLARSIGVMQAAE